MHRRGGSSPAVETEDTVTLTVELPALSTSWRVDGIEDPTAADAMSYTVRKQDVGPGDHTITVTARVDLLGDGDAEIAVRQLLLLRGLRCWSRRFVGSIRSGNDDAEERTVSGRVNRSSTDLEMALDAALAPDERQVVGLRFVDVAVPRGAATHRSLPRVHHR